VPTRIDVPTSTCTIDVAAPTTAGTSTSFGIERLYVGAAPIAHASALGPLRHARLVFVEERPHVAVVEVDGADIALVGAVPLHQGSSNDLVLYPKVRVLRDGWLDYDQIEVEQVAKAGLSPKTALERGIVPATMGPFYVPCTDLTPFGAQAAEPPPEHELRGKGITLEDAAGMKLATLDAEEELPPAKGAKRGTVHGKPVSVLARKGARTQIRMTAGRSLHAEGWVASRFVRASPWGGVGYGSGSGRGPKLDTLTCEREVPIWVDVQGTTFAVGTLHAHRTVSGQLDARNDFRLAIGSGAALLGGAAPKKGDPVDPYVPRHELAACGEAKPPAP